VSDAAYARAGVDTTRADRAVAGLVEVLRGIDPGRPSRARLGSGHYASVLEMAPNLGVALSTDGVGTKVIVAEQLGRFDTVGIDCIAMNVNDVVCVGAEPLAVVDYIAVEDADPDMLRDIAVGLRAGAELAGVEIPGGELAQLPELIRGHPSPRGFDLVGACFGTVALDRLVTGAAVRPGDAVIGLPASGVHSNGLSLVRRALPDLAERPPELDGASVGETLLEPTVIYVRAVLDLLRSGLEVRGLAHITSGGLLNLLRLEAQVGYRIDSPLAVPPIFGLVRARGGVEAGEMNEVFNMGCGFCVVVPEAQADQAVALLGKRHPGAAMIGGATDASGAVELAAAGLRGTRDGGFAAKS
jgi:phosphoribosylformylglycinamidine cyclo-ligase